MKKILTRGAIVLLALTTAAGAYGYQSERSAVAKRDKKIAALHSDVATAESQRAGAASQLDASRLLVSQCGKALSLVWESLKTAHENTPKAGSGDLVAFALTVHAVNGSYDALVKDMPGILDHCQ